MFERSIYIYFHQSDPAAIAFFGQFFSLSHACIEDFLRSENLWQDWFGNPEWGAPLRHVEGDYLRPLDFGKSYTQKLKVCKIGTSSVTFEISYWEKDQLHATTKTTHCFASRKARKKIDIPQNIKQVLQKHA